MKFFLIIALLLASCETNSNNQKLSSTQDVPRPVSSLPTKKITKTKVLSWNLYNFGSKKRSAEEMEFKSQILKDFDIVALQEVNTGDGAEGVARLADQLNRTGSKWDYRISDPTVGPGKERYAYLWKPSRAKLIGKPWLEQSMVDLIDREPYLARFSINNQKVLLVSLHAVPSSKNPAREIKLLPKLNQKYESDNMIFMGDFNLSQKSKAWDKLKAAGYMPTLVNQKTSLKRKKKRGEHLSQEYDNLFVETHSLTVAKNGVIDFTKEFRTLKEARSISDHLPIWIELAW